MDYLSTRQVLNLASMTVSVTSMTFRQDQANVMVTFSPKGQGPAPAYVHRVHARKEGRPLGGEAARRRRTESARRNGRQPAWWHGAPEGGASDGALPPGHPTVPPPASDPK